MAARIRYLHRLKSKKQKLTANLIDSSNCWTGINDYRFKPARTITRNIKKSPTAIGLSKKYLI